MKTFDFLDRAIESWGVYLNAVDGSDCRTALDYLEEEAARYAGSPEAVDLDEYAALMRKAGGRRAKELDASSLIVTGGGVLSDFCRKQIAGR